MITRIFYALAVAFERYVDISATALDYYWGHHPELATLIAWILAPWLAAPGLARAGLWTPAPTGDSP